MDLFLGNDTLLEVDALKDAATGSFLNAATVQATITDWVTGDAIENVSNPVTLSYVAASNGKYRAVLQQDAGFADGQKVRVVITAVESGIDARWEFSVLARRRGFDD